MNAGLVEEVDGADKQTFPNSCLLFFFFFSLICSRQILQVFDGQTQSTRVTELNLPLI